MNAHLVSSGRSLVSSGWSLAPLQTDPWANRFVDLERLNEHASAILRQRLDDVRAAAASGELLPTTSLALLGAAGAGKTHIFARLRRMVGGRASFVLVRPLLGAEPTLRLLLSEVMDQLRRPSFGGTLSQLEALVGGALAARARFPSAGLADAATMDRAERRVRIDDALTSLFALRPELEGIADYARRLLELPFEKSESRGVLGTWLSGRDVDPEASRAAGLPGALSDVDVLRALTVIAALAAAGAPLLIAFDQLENLADATGNRVRAHGNLVAELVDQLPALTLVQLALTGEWMQHVQPALSLPQRTRIAERTVLLEAPSEEDRRDLVRAWLDGLPPESRVGAFPSPLAETEVDRWCREPGMTPRMLLQACRRALEAPSESREGPPQEVAAASSPEPDAESAPAPHSAHAAQELTADAVAASGAHAGVTNGRGPRGRSEGARPRAKGKSESLDGVLSRAWRSAVREARREIRDARGEERLLDVERVAEVLEVTVSADAGSAIVWRRGAGASPVMVGTLASGPARGNVVIVQGHHPRSVATALERARDLASEPLLFVRQGSFDFAPTWKDVAARVTELQGMTRTCWVAISDEVLADGLAFASMLTASRSGELTGPAGEAVSEVALRAWSSAVLADSVDALDGEIRRVVASWGDPRGARLENAVSAEASQRAHAPVDRAEPAPAKGVIGGIEVLLEVAAARWAWGEMPLRSLRWLRAARERRRRR